MADLFKLFDGSLGAGGSAAISNQNAGSFSSVSTENDLVNRLASGTDSVPLLVDYSDFSNFVTFNSAESYVNVTADQILNEYPIGGSADDLQAFIDSLDGYGQYFLELWPSWSGHLRLNPAVSPAYVSFTDFGNQNGAARSSFISPGTGSLSIRGWLDVSPLTGSADVLVVFQKLQDSTSNGITVFVTGSQLRVNVVSGSTVVNASASLLSPGGMFFAAALDLTTVSGALSLYTATTGVFPSLQDYETGIFGSTFNLSSGSFYIGTGSLAGQVVRSFTGSIDSLSVWSTVQGLSALTASYNRRTYAQHGLLAAWNFNDASPDSPSSWGSIVHDSSGHNLDGRIQGYSSTQRGSGSLDLDNTLVPVLTLQDPDVVNYVVQAQLTGATYDQQNESVVWKLFPEAFSRIGSQDNGIFQNFALILARHFDRIKLYVNQLANLRNVQYTGFDQTPDELLENVADFLGWKLDAGFASTDALQYFVGRNVRPNTAANRGLATQMSDIKSQLWRRVLVNLMYIYKTKGTRESVEALLRAYGLGSDFVRIKEYARKNEVRVPLERVVAEKSVFALQFSNGASLSFSPLFSGSAPPTLVTINVSPNNGLDGDSFAVMRNYP